jgi:hypothetical protein
MVKPPARRAVMQVSLVIPKYSVIGGTEIPGKTAALSGCALPSSPHT